MSKILITGGSGTVGSAFIKKYYDKFLFYTIGRSEQKIHTIKTLYPKVECYLCNVENKNSLYTIYDKVRPDVVIHAAALKHVDLAERQPIQTVNINVIGSMNVIQCSQDFNVPITVAISTDKACDHQNLYGVSKYIMERCFLESNTDKIRFSVCRFGNVAHSNGSVIPYWLSLKKQGLSLPLTSDKMNRFMFSQNDAVNLILYAIELSKQSGGFILSKIMKSVNMMDLAKCISDNIKVVGVRYGEKINEDLISDHELPFTKIDENTKYIRIFNNVNSEISSRLQNPLNTSNSEIMSKDEMIQLIYGDL